MDQNSKLSFSQRKGLKPIKEALQVESMDDDLRNTLWTLLYEFYFSKCKRKDNNKDHELYELFQSLWRSHLKKPIDTLHDYFPVNVSVVKRHFFVLYEWNDVYDLLEFIVTNYDNDEVNKNFVFACNLYLEKELSAYRFVAGKIIQITSEDEAIEIE